MPHISEMAPKADSQQILEWPLV